VPPYVVELIFPDGLHDRIDQSGAEVVEANSQWAGTSTHSCGTHDKTKSFCIYDALIPEAIRLSARRSPSRRPHYRSDGPRPLLLRLRTPGDAR
jgi:hypothetical protein